MTPVARGAPLFGVADDPAIADDLNRRQTPPSFFFPAHSAGSRATETRARAVIDKDASSHSGYDPASRGATTKEAAVVFRKSLIFFLPLERPT